jgi:protein O-GlcNAc transferase
MKPLDQALAQARVFLERGDLQSCVVAVQPVLRGLPYHTEANYLAGSALLAGGRAAEAAQHLERAQRGAPKDAAVLLALGEAAFHLGDPGGAKKWFEKLLTLQPGLPRGLLGLSIALRMLGETEPAVEAALQVLAAEPDNLEAVEVAFGGMLHAGRAEEALALLRPVLARHPDNAELMQIAIFPFLYAEPDPAPLTELLKKLGTRLTAACPPLRDRFENARDPQKRLRIGYVSREFHNRWAPRFIGPLIEHRDAAHTEVFCYYQTVMEVERHAQRSPNATWRDTTGIDDLAFARLVRSDRIDILVDMTGWIHGSRLGSFAHRAAPVQMTYLGFPATTGLPAVGYRIVDAVTDPPGSEMYVSERLLRMERCFLCPRPNLAPPVGPPPCTLGAPVTFGSFNSLVKIGIPVLRLWAEVLTAVEGSRLLIKNQSLGSAAARARVQGILEGFGVPAVRVDLRGETPGEDEHMRVYDGVDIALDSFPYNGTTTTFDALWMGVPVVTLLGGSHVARVTASMLTSAGYAMDIAHTPEQYAARCIALAADPAGLAARRLVQREQVRTSALCDGAAFVRELEGRYREAWREWCLGETPAPLSQ